MEQPPPKDGTLIEILTKRDGQDAVAKLEDGRCLNMWNIAWGYDTGDEFAHITTNISPPDEAHDADFFFTSELAALIDPETDAMIYQPPWSKTSE